MGYSILRHKEIPCNTSGLSPVPNALSKGNEVNIPQAESGYCVVTQTSSEIVGMYPWKSYLFFLTHYDPGIGLSRVRVVCEAEQFTLRAVRCVHDDH